MSSFLDRRAQLIIAGKAVEFRESLGLRLSFRVTRSLEKGPNPADVTVYSLGQETRKAAQGGDAIQLSAGYGENMPLLIVGEPDRVWSETHGPDILTRLTLAEKLADWRKVRVRKSFAPGSKPADILRDLMKGTTIEISTAVEKVRSDGIDAAVQEFTRGFTADGLAMDLVHKVLEEAGLEGSVQDGALQVLLPGETTGDTAVVLSAESGLIGSPEVGLEGEVRVESLMNGRVYPGRAIEIRSRHVEGIYRARTVTHDGDTHGRSWYTTIEAEPIGVTT